MFLNLLGSITSFLFSINSQITGQPIEVCIVYDIIKCVHISGLWIFGEQCYFYN